MSNVVPPASTLPSPGDPSLPGPQSRPGLHQLLAEARCGVLLFSLTPPRRSETDERVKQIATVTLNRLAGLDLDGLILYDIDDESDRNPDQRPFPYLPTLDPARYYADHLGDWNRPTIIYRCVGKYHEGDIRAWLRHSDPTRVLSVLVGPSSGNKPRQTDLRRAHEICQQSRPDLMLGGVVISERHTRGNAEHLRMLAKQERGCTFFVSQVVYHVNATKNVISDYFYECRARGLAPRTVIFTLSLCGSVRTLEFLQWLGVDVPRWLQNSIRYAADPLAESYRHAAAIARDLADFCDHLGMPYGFNVESVSIRKDEIAAATELVTDIATLIKPATNRGATNPPSGPGDLTPGPLGGQNPHGA